MQIKTLFDQQLQIPAASLQNPQTLAFPATVNTGQFLEGLQLQFMGRMDITTAGNAVLPESPWSLFKRIYVEIVHDIYGTKMLYNLPGGTSYVRNLLFNRVAPLRNGTAPGFAVGNYDFDFHIPIVFPLEQVVEGQRANTLLDAPRCSNIKVSFDLGDATDLCGGPVVATWSAYGQAGGNPVVNLLRRVVNGFSHNPKTNLVQKSDRVDILSANVASGSFNGQPLPVGSNLIRLLGFKQYLPAGSGVDTVGSFYSPILQTDNGYARPQLFVNSTQIRDFYSWQAMVSDTQNRYQVAVPAGYAVVDFVRDGLAQDALNAALIGKARSTLNYGGIINGVANAQVEVFIDQIMPNPQGA